MATSGKVPFDTEGATITLGSAGTDIKANLIDEPTFDNPEPTINEVEASDGTNYAFNGTEGTPMMTFPIMFTDDNAVEVLQSVYGSGSAVSGGTEFDLRDATGTLDEITITSPENSNGKQLRYKAVNPTGVRVLVTMPLKNGFQGEIKFKSSDGFKLAILD